MQRLIEGIQRVVGKGEVDTGAIAELEELVRAELPNLKAGPLARVNLEPGRYLCYKDPDFGFVIMILAWGKGDKTPIHDHGTWGIEAVLRNELKVTAYSACEENPQPLTSRVVREGDVMHNLPPARDVHSVEHHQGALALSLHIYGREMTGNRSFVPGEGYKCCRLACQDLRKLPGLFDSGVAKAPYPQSPSPRLR